MDLVNTKTILQKIFLSAIFLPFIALVLVAVSLSYALVPETVIAAGSCPLTSSSWAGLTGGNFYFGGVGTPESTHIKDSLCPTGNVMVGTRSYQWTKDVDEEYEEALCASGVTGLGSAIRVEAPNAWSRENPGTKTVVCAPGTVMVGTRMYGIYASVDEEHIDAYCASLPGATVGAGTWRSAPNANATLFGDFKETYCLSGEAMIGVSWFQWPSNVDEEHTDAYCAPLTCAATTGAVNVSSNIAGASYTITGPATLSGSGVFNLHSSQPTGGYTITWNNVAGYTKPGSSSQTLSSGGTISFVGNYTGVAPTCSYTGSINWVEPTGLECSVGVSYNSIPVGGQRTAVDSDASGNGYTGSYTAQCDGSGNFQYVSHVCNTPTPTVNVNF